MDMHAISSLDSSFWKGLHELPTRRREPLLSTNARSSSSSGSGGVVRLQTQNTDLPPVLPKHKKKPFITNPKRGGFLSKKGPKKPLEDCSFPPGNGLLVPELVPVAHAVFEARKTLLQLVSKLMEVVPVKACKFCYQTHVGPVGHKLANCDGPGCDTRRSRHVWTNGSVHDVIANLDAYHSYDRLKLIRHEERFKVKRLPALVELCIQAGVDLPEYPTLRRTNPVRVAGRRIIEAGEFYFELQQEIDALYVYSSKGDSSSNAQDESADTLLMREEDSLDASSEMNNDDEFENACKKDSSDLRDRGELACMDMEMTSLSSEEVIQIAEMTLRIWEMMRSGAQKLMKKYSVRVCGYCPEVHIGPRGHKVRVCGEFKHQWRQGQHGWQEAGIDDLIPPKYVWHVPNLAAPLLLNEMRRYYGQAPAIVELCVQAGAAVPSKYKALMRMDVVVPEAHEAENAV